MINDSNVSEEHTTSIFRIQVGSTLTPTFHVHKLHYSINRSTSICLARIVLKYKLKPKEINMLYKKNI
jgi:hypothetical protein